MAVGPLSSNALSERIDALDYDVNFPWHGTDDDPLIFSYRFETTFAPDFPWTDVVGPTPWNAAEAQVLRTALTRFEDVLNVRFVEDNGAGDADFSFYTATYLGSSATGRGRFRWSTFGSEQEWDGSAVFRADRDLTQPSAFDLILHELGHTMGLKHPGNYDVGGNNPPGPFLPAQEDNERYTLMSYTDAAGLPGWEPDELMLYDVAALQARFGANLSHRTGDDRYTAPTNGVDLIWDGGGEDQIDYDGFAAVRIDLRPGAFSSIGAADNLVIAYDATIEIADGGFGGDVLKAGDGPQKLYGREGADSLYGGKGADTLRGGDGGDRLKGEKGADLIYGGGGADRLIGGNGADRLEGGGGADFLKGEGGADIYVFKPGAGADQIKGFELGVDLIRMPGVSSFDDLDIAWNGGDALISHGFGDTIELLAVKRWQLAETDFVFVG